ncbi:MAG: VanZ family protein [Candidatus Saccharibacteria bacterium]|nr:VanZ family protein [Candidatus Saccharibacteria bacterium]
MIVCGWALVIFILSNQPAAVSSGQSGGIVGYLQQAMPGVSTAILTFLVRKSAHIIAYFVLGILMYRALRITIRRWRTRTVASFALLSCSLYAVTDEIHQLFVPGRSGELRDVMIDSIAALVGVGLCVWLMRRWALRKSIVTSNQ